MYESKVSNAVAALIKEKALKLPFCNCGGFPSCICEDLWPTQSFLANWLRVEKGIDVVAFPGWKDGKRIYEVWIWKCSKDILIDEIFTSYRAAIDCGLEEALKNYLQ